MKFIDAGKSLQEFKGKGTNKLPKTNILDMVGKINKPSEGNTNAKRERLPVSPR